MFNGFINCLAVILGKHDYAINRTKDPEKKFNLLIRLHRYADAWIFAKEFSDYETKQTTAISEGRKYYNRILKTSSPQKRTEILRKRLKLEETAEDYEVAGQIAEDELKDYELSCSLYEKGNLYEKALSVVTRMDNPNRKIDFYIRFGKYEEALEYAKEFNDYETLRDKILKCALFELDLLLVKREYLRAMELIYLFDIEEKKKDTIKIARKYYEDSLRKASSAEQKKEINEKRLKLEKITRNYKIAGKIAEEELHDYDQACSLYEKANLYNMAINAISSDSQNENYLLKLAELHKNGGNLLVAAQYYEKAGQYETASDLYVQISNYEMAAKCYEKSQYPDKKRLAELFEKAGNFDKTVLLLVEIGELEDLEKAKSIANDHNLFKHLKLIDSKIEELIQGNTDDIVKHLKDAEKEVIESYTHCLGIDFGTTNSIGAVYNKVSQKIEIIPVPGTNNNFCEPSFYGIDENNNPVFGEKAKLLSQTSPESVVSRVKRFIGKRKKYKINNKEYTGEEIAAKIIYKIKCNAEIYIAEKIKERFLNRIEEKHIVFPKRKLLEIFKDNVKKFSFDNVVLTVPAFYDFNQKRATKDAAQITGLNVKQLIPEPTAAALAYGYQKEINGKIVVIDLGGGTLDLSYLDIIYKDYQVKTVDGNTILGGSDIDEALFKHVLNYIKNEYNITLSEESDKGAYNRLLAACEDLKIKLSDLNRSSIVLQYFMGHPSIEIPLSCVELEAIASKVLKKYEDKLRSFKGEINIKFYNPDVKILLVGNATKMPAISRIAKNVFGSAILSGIDPSTIVAYGAGVQGAVLLGDIKDTLLSDIVPYSLGVSCIMGNTNRHEIQHLIKRDTKIPTSQSLIFSTNYDFQSEVDIEVYLGESLEPAENVLLDKFKLCGIALKKKGEPQIEVTFDIGNDCVLTVTAKDKETGNAGSMRIYGAVTLSPAEKDKLKTHFSNIEYKQSLAKIREELSNNWETAEQIINKVLEKQKEFNVLLDERYSNLKLYEVSQEVCASIQDMFNRKNNIEFTFEIKKDAIKSIINDIKKNKLNSFDFDDESFLEKAQELEKNYEKHKRILDAAIDCLQKEVLFTYDQWIAELKGMEPNRSLMTKYEQARYCLASKKYTEALEILAKIEKEKTEFTREAFELMLRCYSLMGMREECKKAHQNYGINFGFTYPDLNNIASYLDHIGDSIVIILSPDGTTGTGFAIEDKIIATNKHILGDASPETLKIYGKSKSANVISIDKDPQADIAILRVSDTFKPINIGEFNNLNFGDPAIPVFFPLSGASKFEDIRISAGVITSFRNRSLFFDSFMDTTNSGGPLINEFGEVVGIITSGMPTELDETHLAISADNLKKYIK
jgi:molecular chaperone DnaK